MSDAGLNHLPDTADNKPMLTVVQSAGGQLATARVQAGLSVPQVAEQLKLSQRQIAALENNQFDILPKMVIVRGFVRSYAKLLKLDAEPLIACLPQESDTRSLDTDLRPTLATPFMESRTPFLGRQETHNRKYLIGAALLAALALLFVVAQKLEQTDYVKKLMTPTIEPKLAIALPEATSAAVTETVVQQLSGPSSPAGKDAVASGMSATVVATVAAESEKASAGLSREKELGGAVNTASVAPVVSSMPAAGNVEIADNSLRLKFRQDSWIQIKRDNGSIVTSHLARAGTEEVFEVKESLQLRIGNAAGVDGWLRGTGMGIAASKESNVVNLSVK